jgi:hypothetical protein
MPASTRTPVAATAKYRRDIPPTDAASAEAEPAADRVFTMPEAPVPEPPAAPAVEATPRKIVVQTTVEHRGRQFTIIAEGYTLDQFCDLLERRGYQAPAQTKEWQTLPDGTPLCPKHHAPMKLRQRQGDEWYSHNVGTKDKPIYCKGYHGSDSPGYDL